MVQAQFTPFPQEGFGPDDVKIRFVGKGRTADPSLTESATEGLPADRVQSRASAIDSWRVFNPATLNEFELTAPPAVRSAFDDLILRSDPKPRVAGGPSPEGPNAPFRISAWSLGLDDRVRFTDSSQTYPWSTIADIANCTGTFVGPRHVVTAAHCIYTKGSPATPGTPAVPPAWAANFTVLPGRDAGNVPYSTVMPPGPGESGWYFTPVGWRTAPTNVDDQFDFAVVVVPDRLGDTVSWMGYGALASQEFTNGSPLLLRGYPLCEAQTGTGPGNPERIDEPNDPTTPPTCTANGFYAGSNCSVGTFTVTDADGWSRRLTHGCDASAANSGSSLYTYLNGIPVVVGVHTNSSACAFTNQPPCTAADTHPLVMTRITPEYRGWISYFRKMFP